MILDVCKINGRFCGPDGRIFLILSKMITEE